MVLVQTAAEQAYPRKHFPPIQVVQEDLLGVNQLLLSEGAADILKSFPLGLAAKLDIVVQVCPLTQDAPHVVWPRDAHQLEKIKKIMLAKVKKTKELGNSTRFFVKDQEFQ